ncbi:hypothetical protein ACFQX6_67390 [Streptosporangium lutulentum]
MVQWYGPALVAYCRIWLPDPVAAADAAATPSSWPATTATTSPPPT